MECFTEESVANMLEKCAEYPNYKGAILVRTRRDTSQFERILAKIFYDFSSAVDHTTKTSLHFKNGSLLRVMSVAQPRQRKVTVHEVLYGVDCAEEMPWLRVVQFPFAAFTVDIGDDVLTAFLSEFKVI